MGVTFIKRLENRSRSPITLLNKENSNTKAKDADDFYFASMDHIFVHKAKDAPTEQSETVIPSAYFKIDPEFGKPNIDDLLSPIKDVPPAHPASERYPIFRRVFQSQITDMMIATMEPLVWQQVDCRPPQNVIAMAAREVFLRLAPVLLTVIGLAPGLGPMMLAMQLAYFAFFKDVLADELRKAAEAASAPPDGTPTYKPVTYRRDDGVIIEPPAISFQKVIDIGVGHVHHHQQYQRITGGEIQAMLLVDFYKALYRFFNGAVQDGDGYVDGGGRASAARHRTRSGCEHVADLQHQLQLGFYGSYVAVAQVAGGCRRPVQ